MLTCNYIDDWRLLAKLTATWTHSQEEVYTALEQETYHGNELRTYCHDINSPVLKEIVNDVVNQIPVLLSQIAKDPVFQEKWGFDYQEQILNNVKHSCYIVCDKPGYNTDVHVDNRTQVCTGMLFFNSVDDPDQSTSFYTTHTKENPIRMSSEYKNGWYAANTHDNWHIGYNNTQRNRYAILFISKLQLK